MDHDVTEGHRYGVTIGLLAPRTVARVQVFRQQTDIYGHRSWALAKTLHPYGHHTLKLRLSPIQAGTERTQARAVLKSGSIISRSDTQPTTIWRWTPLTAFAPYYATDGTTPYLSYAINGTEYPPGWMTFATEPSWETRHTLGHHCRAFRGTLGLTDASADGSSATISLSANGTKTLFTSGTLTPGMDTPIRVAMSRIYRLWISATNTSPDADTTGSTDTYPAIGDPELLCTGI